MVCLGFELGTAGWQTQINPLSYVGSHPPKKCWSNLVPLIFVPSQNKPLRVFFHLANRSRIRTHNLLECDSAQIPVGQALQNLHCLDQYVKKVEGKFSPFRAVVVVQLVEQSLPIPEVRGQNPVISKNVYIERLLSTVLKFEKTKGKRKKSPGKAHFYMLPL